jgi:hypothetical protein
MAVVTIYRDVPVIAEKVRPYGTIVDNMGVVQDGRIDVTSYVFGGNLPDAEPELITLTGSPRRGRRTRNSFVRTDWQTAF